MVEFKYDFILSEFQSHFSYVLVRRIHWLAVTVMVQLEFWVWNQCTIDSDIDFFCFTENCIGSKAGQKRSAFVMARFVFDDNNIRGAWHEGLSFEGCGEDLCRFGTWLEKEHL